jgi:hypothetical protein
MKDWFGIALGVIASLGCFAIAFVFTWFVWEMQIPDTAFHCGDGGISLAFWQSATTHASAGDHLLSGWTWEKIQIVNRVYKLAFFALWIGSSWICSRAIHSIRKDYWHPCRALNLPAPSGAKSL